MARQKRIRAHGDEVEALKEARDEIRMFDGDEPLGEVAAMLAVSWPREPAKGGDDGR